jgi:excisionase family DNA binding protein
VSLESELKETVRTAVLEVLEEQRRSGGVEGAPGQHGALDPLQLLTTEEVAALIRYSVEGVRDQIHSGKLRAVMTGAGWRVKRIWLEEWMTAQGDSGEAAPDPDEEARRTVLAIREKRRR